MTPVQTSIVAKQIAVQPSAGPDTAGFEADSVVEHAIRSMLADSPLGKVGSLTVAVHGEVVTLEGIVSDGLALARLKNRITSAIPSVSIDDRVDWVVPDCGIGLA